MANILLILLGVVAGGSSFRVEVQEVLEGQNITLKCHFSNTTLLSTGGQIQWVRQRSGEEDEVAIGDILLDHGYKTHYTLDLEAIKGRYDLSIIRASHENDDGMFKCRIKQAVTGLVLNFTTINLTVLIPPGIPRINTDTPTATEFQRMDLVCSSKGGSPDPQITWYRLGSGEVLHGVLKPGGGQDVPTTSVLTIIPGRDDDGAQFYCQVWNRALADDENMETNFTLNVNYYPRIMIWPKKKLMVELDHPATLKCSVDAKPAPNNVRWTHNGRFISTLHTLVWERVSLGDAGHYVCQASNGLGQPQEAEVILDVLYAPRVTVVASREVDIGEDVVVACNVTANPTPFVIEWFKEDDKSFYRAVDLHLLNVSAITHGKYICRAVNILIPTNGELKQRVGNATVAVMVKHVPGTTYITLAKPVAIQGEQVTLTCGADPPGWPTPSYYWWRHNKNVTLTRGVNYIIPSTSLDNEGIYYCQPSNPLGHGTLAFTEVQVYHPPRILIDLPKNATYRQGETDFNLTCSALGKPQPFVRWLKDGTEIAPDEGLFNIQLKQSSSVRQNSLFTIESTLQFKGSHRMNNQALPTDHGTYQCVFENKVGEVFSTQLIRFEHPPLTVHKINKVGSDIGEDVRLECRMMANPEPQFQWSFDYNLIKPDGFRITINQTSLDENVFSSVLLVRGVAEADYGKYSCKASNSLGSHKALITIQEKGHPEPPTDLHVISHGINYITLGWDEGFNGGFVNIFFQVKVETENGAIMNHDCFTNNPCTLRQLPQHTTFVLQVKAMNEKGVSNLSSPLESKTLVDASIIPVPEQVFWHPTRNLITFRVPQSNLQLQGQVEVQQVETEDWVAMKDTLPISDSPTIQEISLKLDDQIPQDVRIKYCLISFQTKCGNYSIAKKKDMPLGPSNSLPVQYLVALVVVSGVVVVAVIIHFCCFPIKNKLKQGQSDKRGLIAAESLASLPSIAPCYTVGLEP